MLRSDSVVEPASAVVSLTITFCTSLIRFESTELRPARTGTVRKYTGAISQCTDKAYAITNRIPTRDWNKTLMEDEISRSTSVRTFCSLPRVSPLRWSSNTWYGKSSEWRIPSE